MKDAFTSKTSINDIVIVKLYSNSYFYYISTPAKGMCCMFMVVKRKLYSLVGIFECIIIIAVYIKHHRITCKKSLGMFMRYFQKFDASVNTWRSITMYLNMRTLFNLMTIRIHNLGTT